MAREKQICRILKAGVRYMEQLRSRRLMGRAVALAGISAVMIALPAFGSNSIQPVANSVMLQGEPAELPEVTPIPDCDVCDDVDTQPEFPGGITALCHFLAENIKYPSTCDDVQGRVIVRFVVDSTGAVHDPEVVKSELPDYYHKEVIRVVHLMPEFKPAEKDGKPVDAWFTLPINFRHS